MIVSCFRGFRWMANDPPKSWRRWVWFLGTTGLPVGLHVGSVWSCLGDEEPPSSRSRQIYPRRGVNERQGDIHTVLREMKGLRRLQKLIEERLVQASPERVRSNGSIGLGDPWVGFAIIISNWHHLVFMIFKNLRNRLIENSNVSHQERPLR
jgi:hypothetical protein